jgi:hypothetical protein
MCDEELVRRATGNRERKLKECLKNISRCCLLDQRAFATDSKWMNKDKKPVEASGAKMLAVVDATAVELRDVGVCKL